MECQTPESQLQAGQRKTGRGASERQLSRGGRRKRKKYRAMEVGGVHTGARQGVPRDKSVRCGSVVSRLQL